MQRDWRLIVQIIGSGYGQMTREALANVPDHARGRIKPLAVAFSPEYAELLLSGLPEDWTHSSANRRQPVTRLKIGDIFGFHEDLLWRVHAISPDGSVWAKKHVDNVHHEEGTVSVWEPDLLKRVTIYKRERETAGEAEMLLAGERSMPDASET